MSSLKNITKVPQKLKKKSTHDPCYILKCGNLQIFEDSPGIFLLLVSSLTLFLFENVHCMIFIILNLLMCSRSQNVVYFGEWSMQN